MTNRFAKIPQLPWTLTALAVLLPIWCFGLFARKLWMPDEPREYDIARNMLLQDDKLVPHLASQPFLEKPPLTYWMESWSMQLFGTSPAAARFPGIVFATITVLSVGLLAKQWSDTQTRSLQQRSGLVAALVVGTMVIVCQIQIWLATDAAVLACTALALLAAWNFAHAGRGVQRLGWHLTFWLALAAAFLAKSAFGVMVPLLTCVTWITWEKRWSALSGQWQLYVGAAIAIALIASWFVALAHRLGASEMEEALRDNTIGRFFGTAGHGTYELGHRTARFKFLGAIPYYLLPWTFALVGACRWAIRCLRADECIDRSKIRFCLSASLPALTVLGLSATARDVYFGPALLGLSLLISLWLSECDHSALFDRRVLKLTSASMFAMATLAICATVLLWEPVHDPSAARALLQVAAMLVVLSASMLLHREERLVPIASGLTSLVLALLMFEFFAIPTIDRTEDIARELLSNPKPLSGRVALLCGDETTRAVLDFALNLRPVNVCTPTEARSLLQAHSDQKFLIQADNGLLPPNTRLQLAKLHITLHPRHSQTELSSELQSLGLHVESMWCSPGGRQYALYGSDAAIRADLGGDCI